LRTCVCALVARADNRVDVLVLQHPAEAGEAKGSARLLALSLARCRVVVGEVFEPAALQALLVPGSALLYPAETNGASRAVDAPGVRQLVVLDGTWRKSLKMLRSNPLLHALPRWALAELPAGRYGALRKARLSSQLSTLEATCMALSALESNEARYTPLLAAFDRFVDDRVARARRP
jgi:DTW domain-containing protein YfiP